MPPTFQREGIEAAKEMRKRHPGTGVVILSQYDDPEYAIVAPGRRARPATRYLLKDRLAEGDQLVEAIRAVATGGTPLDPAIVDALVRPGAATTATSSRGREELLPLRGRGQPDQGHRRRPGHDRPRRSPTTSSTSSSRWPRARRTGDDGALRRLRMLHQAIVDREEQGETLSRLLPGGLAEKLRREGRHIGETEEVEVTVLMSDIRGYSAIAERADPTAPRRASSTSTGPR